ncbi:Srp72p [Coemansia aciculifera]|uniref:Srp72p n=1 Tax=Coemansia aciculifera TaxID=417176 RepID=A0ACC1M9N2_9FUNG|nr:Srp72p [Coemansia aciculifera]KAJ2908548.1 Srp72p [Coemansia aciculifera]
MPSQSLEAHFSAIRDALAAGNLSAAGDAARLGLNDYPKEADLARIQIVALIKQEKAQQALALIDQARNTKLLSPKDMAYEAAYCNFVVGSYELAKAQLKNAKSGPATAKLAAQIAYKCNQFVECVGIYEALLSETERDSQEYGDLVLNMSAARAAAAAQHCQDLCTDNDVGATTGGYELMFNSATRLLGCGRVQEAASLLDEAAKLATTTLSNAGWSEQDIRGEVCSIEAQRAVALQQIGGSDEARKIYAKLLSDRLLDAATRDVVAHNFAALSVDIAPGSSASASKAKRALQVPGRSAGVLSCYQKTLMAYNMAVLQTAQKQYAAARRSLRALGKSSLGAPVVNAGALSATISLRMGRGQQALSELAAMSFAQDPVSGVRTTLAAAQVAIQLGDNKRAAEILEAWVGKAQGVAINDLKLPAKFARHYFGACLLRNWLLNKLGLGSSEPQVADEAARHLYAKAAAMQQQNVDLLVAVGDCLAYAGSNELARECFERAKAAASEQGVNASTASSTYMLALLAPEFDSKSTAHLLRGYKHRAKLAKAVPGLPTRMARRFQPRSNALGKESAAPMIRANHSQSVSLNRRRARRSRKLAKSPPKNYEAGRVLDAERWIPMRQRSYYKPRGRAHRLAKLRGGAQGGAVDASSGLGGTGSARISGKAVSPALAQTSSGTAANIGHGNEDGVPSSAPDKGKPKAGKSSKGGKGKGKKSSW